MLDQLTLLVDKSLVVAENTSGRTRYRLLETVRQYALEKLGESGEADDVRTRHRDHYHGDGGRSQLSRAGLTTASICSGPTTEIDNLRAAFRWSLEIERHRGGTATGVVAVPRLAGRRPQRRRPGMAGSGAWAGGFDVTGRIPRCMLARSWTGSCWWRGPFGQRASTSPNEALALAREVGDPALLIRGLIARGDQHLLRRRAGRRHALPRPPNLLRGWMIHGSGARSTSSRPVPRSAPAIPVAVEDAAAKGTRGINRDRKPRDDAGVPLGPRLGTCMARRLARCLVKLDSAIEDAADAHDTMLQLYALLVQGFTRAYLGDSAGAHASADAALAAAADLMEFFEGLGHATVAVAYQAAGDDEAASHAYALARQRSGLNRMMGGLFAFAALAPLACGDLPTAQKWADETVEVTGGCYRPVALMTRAQVMLAQGEMDGAEQDAQAALAAAPANGMKLRTTPDTRMPGEAGGCHGKPPRSGSTVRGGAVDAAAHR